MRQAQGAETDPPAITRKPAEFIGQRAGIATAPDGFKTPDFINDSMGVGKCMAMRSISRNSIGRSGNRLLALATKYIFFILRLLFFSFFFLNDGGYVIPSLFGRLAQKMKGVNICGNHI
jgi:hypothetical protein